MIDRNTPCRFTVALAAAALLIAAGGSASAAHAGRGPTGGTTAAAPITQPGHPSASWGYGRGWCYWHPYACYRY